MNNKFYSLPQEKQDNIINAGFRVFATNSYKKSPMSEIAEEAGISKSLLFHYFTNKKELYLFLYDYAVKVMMDKIYSDCDQEETDFFEIVLQSTECKCKIMKQHPYLNHFLMRTYYEDNSEITDDITERNKNLVNTSIANIMKRIDFSKFKAGTDVGMLLRIITWSADGYMREKLHKPPLDADDLFNEFSEVIKFWRISHYKEGK